MNHTNYTLIADKSVHPDYNLQTLMHWQSLWQQTCDQAHLGQILALPRWAEVSQLWKAS